MREFTENYKTKFLTFGLESVSDTGKTATWTVGNLNGQFLGQIRWMVPWRKYVFDTNNSVILDISCMNDIITFINLIPHMYKE